MSTFSDNIQATRAQQALKDKERAEFNGMIAEMKRTQAAVLAGGSKPTVILTDQTDLGDKVAELKAEAVRAIKGLDSSEIDKSQLAAIRTLSGDMVKLEAAFNRYITAIERQTVQLLSALNKLNLSPQITVPEPRVMIKEAAPVDMKPLENAINSLRVAKTTNLGDYRAHDLDTSPDGLQYVGYIAMDGSWYIIQSNESSNTMRYCFGKDDYRTAWDERFGHDYTTLSEAIHALAT